MIASQPVKRASMITDRDIMTDIIFADGQPWFVYEEEKGAWYSKFKAKPPKSYFEAIGMKDTTDEIGRPIE